MHLEVRATFAPYPTSPFDSTSTSYPISARDCAPCEPRSHLASRGLTSTAPRTQDGLQKLWDKVWLMLTLRIHISDSTMTYVRKLAGMDKQKELFGFELVPSLYRLRQMKDALRATLHPDRFVAFGKRGNRGAALNPRALMQYVRAHFDLADGKTEIEDSVLIVMEDFEAQKREHRVVPGPVTDAA